MNRVVDTIARAVTGAPWLVIALAVAVSIPAAIFASRVTIDGSAESLVRPDDPAMRFYAEVRDLFGDEGVDAVVLVGEDVFQPATLEKIRRIDERIGEVRGVDRVRSLATLEVVTSAGDGSVAFGAAMPETPATPEGIERLRGLVREHPLLGGTFVSRDGKAAMLLVEYEAMPEAEFVKSGIVESLEAILADESGPEEIRLVGMPALRVASARTIKRDLGVFGVAAAAVIVTVLWLSFRSLRGVAVPLVTVSFGILWMAGLMGAVGARIDFLGMALPSLLLAIGSAYATHVVAGYYDELEPGRSPRETLARVLGHVALPTFVSALTTIAGFASLLAYRVPAIRSFGAFMAVGIAALFVLALTLAVALLAVLPPPRRRIVRSTPEWPWLRRVLDDLVGFGIRRRRLMLAVALVLVVGFAVAIPRIELDSNYTTAFPASSPERLAADLVDRHFGGSVNFLVTIDGSGPRSVAGIEMLRRIDALERFIERVPGIGDTSSIVDVVKLVHRALHDDDPGALVLPDSDAAVQQYLLLVPPEATERFVLPDESRAVVHVRSSLRSSRDLGETLRAIEAFARQTFPPDTVVRTTGWVPLTNQTADELAMGQVQSVLVALAVVFVAMAIFFSSLRLAVAAMLPNLVPIVVYFGLLGWTGIPLGMSTALIASMALGLGVDEAVHLLSDFDAALRRHGDRVHAIREAMSTVGPPVVFTTVALSLGFLVQALSGFVPVRQFGALSALNVFTSLLADLLLLPAFVASLRFANQTNDLAPSARAESSSAPLVPTLG